MEVLENILYRCEGLGLHFRNLTFSPITGPKGNIEFLVHLYKGYDESQDLGYNSQNNKNLINNIVRNAHKKLKI